MSSKVSFTVRRPTPSSEPSSSFRVPQLPNEPTPIGSPLPTSAPSSPRPPPPPSKQRLAPEHPDYDSSDDQSSVEDELVTGFDRFGVERLGGEKKPVKTPLVIPALQNKDWRELARKRRGATSYVPPSAAAVTGKDGSVGGLGTRDAINSGPVLSGLQVRSTLSVDAHYHREAEEEYVDVKMVDVKEEEESEDQKALRAILAEAGGESSHDGPTIDIIPTPVSEADALKQDVEELPDVATLADYARVPVSQFGAALLRGMGWKEGTAATRKPGKGLVEPYIPAARPALLGIGAKEQEVYDDGSKKGNKKPRPERRYVPIIKQERSGSGTASPGGARDSSRRRDRSRSPRRSAASSRRPSPDHHGDTNGSSGRRGASERDRDKDMDKRRNEDRERRRNDDKGGDRDRRHDQDRDWDKRRDNDGYRWRDDGPNRPSRKDSGYDRRRDH
ncbi:DExH-box splicing factor binding site-domain-containing protein [Pholiota molesta]|nr:DExH-box splicing factor binding site-domain-containing protein [Pholiota molesta]